MTTCPLDCPFKFSGRVAVVVELVVSENDVVLVTLALLQHPEPAEA